MAPRNYPVPVTLPHPALPLADWADCYELRVQGRALTARSAAERTLGDFPAWVRALMWLRNAAVRPFGLKGSGPPNTREMIGIFPILSRSDEQMVLGFDDAHLDFRIVVDVHPARETGQTVSVTTLVRRKILLGKLYLAVITPFHRLIVRTMLDRLSGPAVVAS
ncbi:DUF2867 domain-containing protein [Pararhizobium sp. LjRoot238]|uniref:DUF2867 domain-containing protein n=1 Tax=Pararhizobium sp. LjRoot238 TaxID=3342293 RepID=UPI003ECD5BDB